jgi:glycerol-3-phosphate O-acyltransferase 1/2
MKKALPTVDILKVTQHASSNNKLDWGNFFPYLAQNLRLKKYDFKYVFESVIESKMLKEEIERVAKYEMRDSGLSYEEEDQKFEAILKKYTERAHRLLLEMRCTLSDGLLRLTSFVLYKLLPWFLSGVRVHPAQIDMIKVAQKKMQNTPLVFLPLHRSHLDYILVTFILLNNGIKCPQVAAGDNLNIPVFG